MSNIVVVNYLLCITTSIILLTLWWRRRYLMIKPSFIVIVFFHLRIQWAATIGTIEVENFLLESGIFYLIAHGFPLIGLFGTLFILPKQTNLVFQRLQKDTQQLLREQQRAARALLAMVAFVAIYYFSVIPFTSTGLFSIFSDPINSAQAREQSLKLVDDIIIKYSFSFTVNAIALLLIVLLYLVVQNLVRQRRRIHAVVYLIIIVSLFLFVSVTGARVYAAELMLAMIFTWINQRGGRINVVFVVLAVLLVLTFPTLLSVVRSGYELSFSNIATIFKLGIFRRVFVIPMETALWHMHYAQNIGLFGVAGIPKLASLLGSGSLNVANLIGIYYTNSPLDSISANTAYVYSYYSYFGIISFPFSLLALWLLDGVILLYRRLSIVTLLPCAVAIQVASVAFNGTDYTRVLVTNGFLVILIVAWLLDRVYRPKPSAKLVSAL